VNGSNGKEHISIFCYKRKQEMKLKSSFGRIAISLAEKMCRLGIGGLPKKTNVQISNARINQKSKPISD
jgi:hypothetical protein